MQVLICVLVILLIATAMLVGQLASFWELSHLVERSLEGVTTTPVAALVTLLFVFLSLTVLALDKLGSKKRRLEDRVIQLNIENQTRSGPPHRI